MASNLAYDMEYEPARRSEVAERAMLQISETTRPRDGTTAPEKQVFKVDLGLRAGVAIDFTPDRRMEFPQQMLSLIASIREFERLPAGWDSYDSEPLSDDAVRAAVFFIVEGERDCTCADQVVPLSNGGLGLRWQSANAKLEVDVDPDGTCEALFEAEGAEIELPPGSSLTDALALIARFRRSR